MTGIIFLFCTGVGFASQDYLGISTAKVQRGEISEIVKLNGILSPLREETLTALGSGYLVKRMVKSGDYVQKDQVLLQIEVKDLAGSLRSAQEHLKLAREEHASNKKLYASNIISKLEFEQSQAALIDAETQYKNETDARTIRAPFAGYVENVQLNTGSQVTAGQSLVTIHSADELRIKFHLEEKYYRKLVIGQPISFTTEVDPDKVFTAAITEIGTAADRHFSIYIEALFNNKEAKLLPGSYADITLKLDTKPNVLLIPAEALIPTIDGYTAYKVSNNTAQLVKIKTGFSNGDQYEVIAGLKEGDIVATTGKFKLKDGQQLTPAAVASQ